MVPRLSCGKLQWEEAYCSSRNVLAWWKKPISGDSIYFHRSCLHHHRDGAAVGAPLFITVVSNIVGIDAFGQFDDLWLPCTQTSTFSDCLKSGCKASCMV